jgi:hypothetical protein
VTAVLRLQFRNGSWAGHRRDAMDTSVVPLGCRRTRCAAEHSGFLPREGSCIAANMQWAIYSINGALHFFWSGPTFLLVDAIVQ